MKEYLLGLFVLAICCSVVELMSAQGGLAGHVKLMSALCVLCVMIAPVSSLLQKGVALPELLEERTQQWLDSLQAREEDYEQRWQEEGERLDIDLAGRTVAQMICQRFSLQESDCQVEITPNESKTGISEVRVALSGRAKWTNTHQIQQYLEQTLGCSSTIYVT